MSDVPPHRGRPAPAAFGDSVVRGEAATVIGETNWVALLARDLGWPVMVNHGVDGSQVFDHADTVFDTVVGAGSVSTWMGLNDQRLHGASSRRRAAFASAHLAELAWLALPEERKVRGCSAAVQRSGTWIDNPFAYGGHLGAYSEAKGSTASISLHGRAVYVCTVQQVDNGSAVSVAVDGTDHGLVPTRATVPPTLLGRAYGPALVRIGGLADGPHRVVLSVVDADPANRAHLLWAAGSGAAALSGGPFVFSGNVLRQTPSSYAAHGGSEADVVAYNDVIRMNCHLLAQDGLGVVHVDVAPYVDPGADLAPDGFHPDDRGHARIRDAFLAAMEGLPRPLDRMAAEMVATRRPVREDVHAVAAAGTAQRLPDVGTATVHDLRLTAPACALTLPPPGDGKRLTLVLRQDAAGRRSVVWPPAVRWPGGKPPRLTAAAHGVDVVTLLCTDGVAWLASVDLDLR